MDTKNIKRKIKNIKKEQIIIFCVGLVIGLLTMVIFYPERIAELKNKEEVAITIGKTNITADKMFINLKEKYSLNSLLEMIDTEILNKKYEMSESDNKNIEELADRYLSAYKENYNMTEEEFLKSAGYENKEEFQKSLELDYKRNKYYQDYMLDNIEESEITEYYEENVFGKINTEHILVKSEHTNAEETAKEILNELEEGSSWDEVKEKYKSDITTEEVSISFDSSLESAYVEAAKKLEDESYTTSLVKTSYGYHIILRVSTEEKEEQKTLTERIKNAIILEEQKKDTQIYEKVMIKMREIEGVEIKDTELKKVYEKYLKQYNE